MPVISFTSAEPWFVPNYEFRILLERALPSLESNDDQYTLLQAVYLSGLHFKRTSADQSVRLARALVATANALRGELMSKREADQRDREFGEALGVLQERLSEMLTELACGNEVRSRGPDSMT